MKKKKGKRQGSLRPPNFHQSGHVQKKIMCPTRILIEQNASSKSYFLETHRILIIALLITRWECLAMAEGERMEKNYCPGESWVNRISSFFRLAEQGSKVESSSFNYACCKSYDEVGELSNSKH